METQVRPIPTFLALLHEVKEKFSNAKKLSKDSAGCFYRHTVNGVGCAIGCVLPAQLADQMDEKGSDVISEVHRNTPELYAQMLKHISSDIQIEDLIALQEAHDESKTVDEFRAALDLMIEQYPEANH